MSLDLFGHQIVDPPTHRVSVWGRKRRLEIARGYAARPGGGPQGETCKTCQFAVCHKMSKRYWKCAIIRHRWTGSISTDIRLKSPACSFWQPKAENTGPRP